MHAEDELVHSDLLDEQTPSLGLGNVFLVGSGALIYPHMSFLGKLHLSFVSPTGNSIANEQNLLR